MRIFDPHIHMTSRTTDDYRAMAAAGVRAVVEPAFWLGQPRTNPGSFADYFDSLIGWEPFRAASSASGTTARIALNPKEANDPRCRERARPAAPLPGQGRRGRGRRDRLRLDDPGRGRGVRRAARAGRRVRAARAGAHPAPGQGRRHPAHPRRGRGVRASSPGRVAVDHLNEVTVGAGPRLRLLDGLLHLPRHQDVAAADGRDPQGVRHRADAGQLGRRLGHVRPAADRGAPARRCSPPGSATTTWTGCCGATRSSSTASPAASTCPTTERRRHLRGQLDRAGRQLMRLRHPDGQLVHLAYCTNVHPAEDLAGILAPARHVRGAGPRAAGRRRARPRAVAGRAGRRRARRRRRRAAAAAPRARRARAGGGHPQRLPVPGLPGAGGQARRLPARLDRPRSGWRTPWTWPGCWPTCCPTTPPGARSPPCRWPGATRGTPPGRPRCRRQPGRAGRGSLGRAATGDDPGGLRARARLRRRDHRPGRPAAGRGGHRAGSGVCLDLAHLACAWEDPAEALRTLRRRRACRGQGPGVGRAGQATDPARGRRGARRRTSSRASCTRPAARGGLLHRRPRRGARGARRRRPALAGALPRAAARRRPCRRCARTVDVLRRVARRAARRAGRAAATTSTSRRTPGTCCRRPRARTAPPSSPPASPPSWPSPGPS